MLKARSGTKFLTISANPILWTLFGSHKELGGASTKMWFKFGQYMARIRKVLVSFPSFMKELILYYVYFFIKSVEKLVSIDILGSRKLPSLIENVVSTFVEDH